MQTKIEDFQFIEKLKTLKFIDEIWLFGSRARGDHAERSDIDLAIIAPTASGTDWIEVMDVIEEADTLLKIDCVRFDSMKDENFRQQIKLSHKVIYKRDSGI